MFKQGLFASSLLAASISTAVAAPYGFFDARSIAMGNTSVATGSMSSAAFSNPALLVNNVSDDSFVISLGAGATVLDNGGVIDTIDNFQTVDDELVPLIIEVERLTNPNNVVALTNEFGSAQALVDAQIAAADAVILKTNEQIADLNSLNGDSLLGKLSPGLMIGYTGESFSLALSAQVNAIFSGGFSDTFNVPEIETTAGELVTSLISGSTVDNVIGNPSGTLRAIGALATEVGLSVATKLTVAGMDVAVGVKPKIISAEAINYTVSLENFDTGDIADQTSEDLGSFTTMDAGITVDVAESFRAGLVATNLISKTLTLNNGIDKIDFDTKLRVGAAYSSSFVTLAVDMDLTETSPIQFEDPTKMLAAGLELNAFNFMQLRFGYQNNIASGANSDPLYSAGIGLWLLGVDLQLAAVGNADSVGAFIQTGVRF